MTSGFNKFPMRKGTTHTGIHVAKKEHICDSCGDTILSGEEYYLQNIPFLNQPAKSKCLKCRKKILDSL